MTSESSVSHRSEPRKKLTHFLEVFKSNELSKVVIVCDFDQTISSNGSLITHQAFPENTKIRSTGELLLDKQIVMNKNYAIRERKTSPEGMAEMYMEWWNDSHELIKNSDFLESQLRLCAERITYRDGAEEFIRFCETNNLPLIIFSAGVANIIRECLTLILRSNNPRNVFVIGNEMSFQLNGSVDSFSPAVHSLNKTYECFAHELDFRTRDSTLCIVIGDSPSDANMMNGSNITLLKIGVHEGKDFFDASLEEGSFSGLTSWLQQLRTDKR